MGVVEDAPWEWVAPEDGAGLAAAMVEAVCVGNERRKLGGAAREDAPRAAPQLPPKPKPAISIPDVPAPGGVSLLLFAALALLAAAAGVAIGTTGATERLRRVMDELS